IDDLVLLTLFFARRASPFKIVVGQYLGFAAITLFSLLGAGAAFAIPQQWIHYLGLLPLAIGLKELFSHRSERAEDDTRSYGLLSIALITLSNGADNIGVYIPFFALNWQQLPLILLTYAALVALWCAAGRILGNRPVILRFVDRWGHRITPF